MPRTRSPQAHKKLHHLATLRGVGAVSLTVLASFSLFASVLYSILAFSEGWLPHSFVAALISIASLILIMKGVKVFNQPLSELEKEVRRQKRNKLRKMSTQDMECAEDENDMQTKQNQQDADANSEMTNELTQADSNPDLNLAELGQAEHLVDIANPLPEQLAVLKDNPQLDPTLEAKLKSDQESLSDGEANPAITQNVAQNHDKTQQQSAQPAAGQVAVLDTRALIQPITALAQSAVETAEKQASAHYVAAHAKTDSQTEKAAKTDTPSKEAPNTQAKSTTESTKQFKSEAGTTAKNPSTISSANQVVASSATKSLQFVEVLLKVVNKVVDGIKNIMSSLTSSVTTASSVSDKASPPNPNHTPQSGPS
jgi:hypothetical protein